MHTLYDSETFTVTHMLANAQAQDMSPASANGPGNTALSEIKTAQYPQGVPMLARTASLIAHLNEELEDPIGFALSYQAARDQEYTGSMPKAG